MFNVPSKLAFFFFFHFIFPLLFSFHCFCNKLPWNIAPETTLIHFLIAQSSQGQNQESLLTWALNWSLWGRITCRPIHVFARILHYLFYMAPSIGKPALAHWHRAPHPSTAPHLLFSIYSTSFASNHSFCSLGSCNYKPLWQKVKRN